MSWIKKNYHIAALGGGALVLVGLGFAGYSGNQAVNEAFQASNPPKKDTVTCEGGPLADQVIASVTETKPVEQAKTATGRPVDLFTSVNLYTKSGNKRQLLDLLQMDRPVHPPIPNQWWVDHRIDPSFSDSPQKDQDDDGFTNREEYEAKTDPNDPKEYGELVEKLEVVAVESDMWLLLFNSVIGNGYQFNFKYRPFGGRTMDNRMGANVGIDKGDLFFEEEPGKQRFKLIEIESRMEDGPTGRRPRDWAILEDQLENKKGTKYELPFAIKKKDIPQNTNYDHTVVFRLNAIGEAGNKFPVKENVSFSLPSGGEEAGYKLIKVILGDDLARTPKEVVVEYKAGDETKTRTIPVPQAPADAPKTEDSN